MSGEGIGNRVESAWSVTRRGRSVVALGVMVSFVFTFGLLALTGAEQDEQFKLGMAVAVSLAAGIMAYPFLRLRNEGFWRVLARPVGLWSLTVAVYWVAGSALVLYTDRAVYWAPDKDFVLRAQLYFVLGGVALLFGYFGSFRLGLGGTSVRTGYRWTDFEVLAVMLVLRGALFAFSSAGTGIDSVARVSHQTGILLATLIGALAWVAMWDPTRARWIRGVAALLVLDHILRFLTMGSRFGVIIALVPGLVAAILFGRRQIKLRHATIVAVVLVLGSLTSQVARSRFGYVHDWPSGTSHISVLSEIVPSVTDPEVRGSAGRALMRTATSRRLAFVDVLAFAVSEIREHDAPMMLGRSMLSGLRSVLLPYFLFPDKVTPTSSEQWLLEHVGISDDVHSNAVQEFYLNFGLTGVLIGMCLLGGVWRIVETTLLYRYTGSTAVEINYIIFATSILTAEREMMTYLFLTLRSMAVVMVIAAALYILKRRGMAWRLR